MAIESGSNRLALFLCILLSDTFLLRYRVKKLGFTSLDLDLAQARFSFGLLLTFWMKANFLSQRMYIH